MQLNLPEQAVDDLAIALGMWMGTHLVTNIQAECFVESVLVLAFKAGVEKSCITPVRCPFPSCG